MRKASESETSCVRFDRERKRELFAKAQKKRTFCKGSASSFQVRETLIFPYLSASTLSFVSGCLMKGNESFTLPFDFGCGFVYYALFLQLGVCIKESFKLGFFS